MSDLVMRAAELIAVIVKERVDEAGKAAWLQHNATLMQSDAARSAAERERDEARAELADSVSRWSKTADNISRERDGSRAELRTVRAELATVRAERDALEARLAALTPATVEVDGFRVGDLVRHTSWAGGHREIKSFEKGGDNHVYVRFGAYEGGWSPSNLRRKPVEVGDTVRTRLISKGVVKQIDSQHVLIDDETSVTWAVSLRDCIAVAP